MEALSGLMNGRFPTRKPGSVGLALLCCVLLVLAGCGRSSVASPQGDRGAAVRAAADESRQQPGARQSTAPAQPGPALLTSADLMIAYRSILDAYVDPVDHAELIEAVRSSLRQVLAESGALPIDLAPLDYLPLVTGNTDRDFASLSGAFDAVLQRHPVWALEARPDYAAIRQMLARLDDNHTTFIPAEEAKRRAETSYSGIGIRIARLDQQGLPVVVEVFPSSPAAVAGVRVGDRIVAIEQQTVRELDLSAVANLIRGPQGSEVGLQLERSAAGGAVNVRALRRSIDTPTADGQVLEPRVGYIKIRSFTDVVPDRVGRLLLEQRQAGVEGWIIDLRGNPGGSLVAVARVAGYFLNRGPIGISVDRSGQRETILAEARPFTVRAPLVLLIDGDSGSASEILASALKEYGLATLVGQNSAGSVGIANVRPLSDGSNLQVTVRRLLSASGRQLDKVGVKPDVTAELSAQDLETGRDPQRDQAVEVLRQRLAGS